MSKAVGSFDAVLSNADNVDGLKDGLVQVTGGLGTAFDTTFLALVISVFWHFHLRFVKRLKIDYSAKSMELLEMRFCH